MISDGAFGQIVGDDPGRTIMAKVLIVYHSLSGNTRAAADAVAEGVRKAEGAEAKLMEALKATPEDLLDCAALAVGTPDYFSYMAGGVKDFFDRAYYPTQGKVTDKPVGSFSIDKRSVVGKPVGSFSIDKRSVVGKPVGIFVTHGGGGKAVTSVKEMIGHFRMRLACAPVLVLNHPDEAACEKLRQLGLVLGKLAASGD
jgi:flavorubredoxin